MSKVKLTQEQADAIEHLKRSSYIDFQGCLKRALNFDWFDKFNRPLNDLTAEEFARAWIEGYEVEPQFEEGDVVFNDTPAEQSLFKVITSNKDGVCLISESGNKIFAGNKRIRHATELEKQLFELGRTKPKLKEGDVIEIDAGKVLHSRIDVDTNMIFEVDVEGEDGFSRKGKIKHVYPIEHRIKVGDENDQVI